MSLPQKQLQAFKPFRDVTEGPLRVLSMEIQASSFTTSDNDSFPSAFVQSSTNIAVLIAAFLIRMSVQAGQGAPISFNTRFSVKGEVKGGLNSE